MNNIDKCFYILQEGSVTIETSQWQASSGKKVPNARGMWFFCKTRSCDVRDGEEGVDFFTPKGSLLYKEAKAEAIKWAKEKGYYTIYLAP